MDWLLYDRDFHHERVKFRSSHLERLLIAGVLKILGSLENIRSTSALTVNSFTKSGFHKPSFAENFSKISENLFSRTHLESCLFNFLFNILPSVRFY